MADDLHYVPGDYYRIDDRTGFKVRAKRTKKEWNNYIVREQSWEARQPQDFVRGRRDDQTVPDPRPRSPNVFIGVQTTISVGPGGDFGPDFGPDFSHGGLTNLIFVESAAGMNIGDPLAIQLDTQDNFYASIVAITGNGLLLTRILPAPASVGNLVVDFNPNAVYAQNLPSSLGG